MAFTCFSQVWRPSLLGWRQLASGLEATASSLEAVFARVDHEPTPGSPLLVSQDLSSAGASAARASSPRRVKIRCIEAPQRLGVEVWVKMRADGINGGWKYGWNGWIPHMESKVSGIRA